jgi:hypothetical protein
VTPEDVSRIFDELFTHARARDEFEYACTLLRVRGVETVGWDPLLETAALFRDVGSLLEAPLNDYASIRLGLLLYSHLTEVDAIYQMLFNLIEVAAGERYVIDPFHDLYRPAGRPRSEQYPPSAKRVAERLKEKAHERGETDVAELVDWFFNSAVRNAFFHSDYILHADEFRSRDAVFVDPNGVRTASMKLASIVDLINRGMTFYQAFIDVYERHRKSYNEDKPIRGRFGAQGEEIDLTLLADPERGGLYGFRG